MRRRQRFAQLAREAEVPKEKPRLVFPCAVCHKEFPTEMGAKIHAARVHK